MAQSKNIYIKISVLLSFVSTLILVSIAYYNPMTVTQGATLIEEGVMVGIPYQDWTASFSPESKGGASCSMDYINIRIEDDDGNSVSHHDINTPYTIWTSDEPWIDENEVITVTFTGHTTCGSSKSTSDSARIGEYSNEILVDKTPPEKPVILSEIQTEAGRDEALINMLTSITQDTENYITHYFYCEVDRGDGIETQIDGVTCAPHGAEEDFAWLAIPRYSDKESVEAEKHEYTGTTYDGASAVKTETKEVRVFKDCKPGENWLVGENPGGKKHFLCPSSETSQQFYDQSFSRTKVYNCYSKESIPLIEQEAVLENYPDYMRISGRNDTYFYEGDYYTCSSEEEQWIIDPEPPTVKCENCITKRRAEVNENVGITPKVIDNSSGVRTYQVCTDQECSNVIGEQTNCFEGRCEETTFQYSTDEFKRTNIYVKATDRQGNTATERIGYVETRKIVGDYCESDEQCLSGFCADEGEYENTCRPPREPPGVVITD